MDLKKQQLAGIVTLALIIGGIVGLNAPEDTYYCKSRDIVLECNKLSSTAKTCYYGTTYKRCAEGWKPIADFIDLTEQPEQVLDIILVNANNKFWKCNTEEGEVNSYTKCMSGIYEAYLGEIV